MNKREYVIAAPGYAHQCGGIKSLHKLCSMLNDRGYTAYVTGDYMNPELNTRSIHELKNDPEHLRQLQHEGIIVYPDIVPNNPCRFTHAVKWWLGATQPPPPNQIVFAFSDMHQVVHKADHNLFIWYIEDFFKEPETENRSGTCVYPGKGGGMDHNPIPETGTATVRVPGCTLITGGFPAPRQKLANLFQNSEMLYCYDNLTVMTVEARLCGCPVMMICHNVMPREQYIEKDEFGIYGIGMYDEKPDMGKIKEEMPLFKEVYNKRFEKTEKELDLFIEETQNWNPNNIYVDDPGPYLPNIYGHPFLKLWGTR